MSDGNDQPAAATAARPMHRADFLFGLVLLALGLGAAAESWRMPRLAELGVHPMTAPGLVPGLLGLVIAGLAAILLVRAVRGGGWRLSRGDGAVDTGSARRFAIALLLCVGYAVGLIGLVPFWAATATFVALFIAVFEWRPGRGTAEHVRSLAVALVEAAVVAAAISYVFETIFLVRLP